MSCRRNLKYIVIVLIFFITAASTEAISKNLYVPGEYKKIQQALDTSNPGDTIWVAGGEYFESLEILHDVVIFGSGTDKCIVHPLDIGKKPTIYIKGNSSIIDGLTIDGSGGSADGCVVIDGGSPRLSRVVIKNGHLNGINVKSGNFKDIPIIKHCKIYDNREVGIQVFMSAALLENNEIYGNGANGVSCIESSAGIVGNKIYDNGGVGIIVRKSVSASDKKTVNVWARISNNKISRNKEGGIVCDKSEPLIKGNKIDVKTGKPDILLFSSSPIISYNELESSGPPAIMLMEGSFPTITYNKIIGTLRFPIMGVEGNVVIKNNEILSPWKKVDILQ